MNGSIGDGDGDCENNYDDGGGGDSGSEYDNEKDDDKDVVDEGVRRIRAELCCVSGSDSDAKFRQLVRSLSGLASLCSRSG